MADLGYTSKLQIVIVPSGKTYRTPDNKTGLLIFREGNNTIEVNGHDYKATSAADLTAIITALKNTGYLTEGSGGVLTANNPGTVSTLLGTKIATASGEGVNTVSGWIESLQLSISNINTNITNLQNATKTDSDSNFVVRDKTVEGTTDFANTTAIHTAINTAKNDAISAAATDATQKVNIAKSDLIGTGIDSTDAASTELNPGTGNTWSVGEANTKTLSHLKDLILNLQGQLNTLSGSDLENITKAIDDIKKELIDPANASQTTVLNTILDHLKTLYGGTTEQSFNVNGGTQNTLAGIITALETEISTVATNALPKGTSSYANAAALEAGLKGNSTSDDLNSETIAGAKKYADSKSSAAQAAAEAKAKTYADNVITWTIISE